MAKNNGFLPIEGTLNGLTFYKANGQNLVKTKSGVSKSRILTEKAFQRTRENMEEFGGSAKVAKAFRSAFAGIVKLMSDRFLSARLTMMMKKILNNGVGNRGEREINIEGYGYMLNGVEFNGKLPFTTIFTAPSEAPVVSTTRDSLKWTVPSFNTDNYVNAPEGATHFELVLAGGFVSNYVYQGMSGSYESVDPEVNGKGAVAYSSTITLGGMVGSDTVLDLDLSAVGTVPVTSMLFGAVGILFYQEVNGKMYLLSASNAMMVAVVG